MCKIIVLVQKVSSDSLLIAELPRVAVLMTNTKPKTHAVKYQFIDEMIYIQRLHISHNPSRGILMFKTH